MYGSASAAYDGWDWDGSTPAQKNTPTPTPTRNTTTTTTTNPTTPPAPTPTNICIWGSNKQDGQKEIWLRQILLLPRLGLGAGMGGFRFTYILTRDDSVNGENAGRRSSKIQHTDPDPQPNPNPNPNLNPCPFHPLPGVAFEARLKKLETTGLRVVLSPFAR